MYRSTALEGQTILFDREARKKFIRKAAEAVARDHGGNLLAASEEDLLDEVTDLVEAPAIFLGRFDESFLSLPQYAIIFSQMPWIDPYGPSCLPLRYMLLAGMC